MSSPSRKNISLFPKGKSSYELRHPVPGEGALAIVTERWDGMWWTRQRRARGHGRRAGEIWSPVSGQGAQTNGGVCVRKNRVGLTPQGLASSLRRPVIQPALTVPYSQATVSKKPDRRGERDIIRRTIAQGRPGVPAHLRSVMCILAHDCGCRGHPAFPAPSD